MRISHSLFVLSSIMSCCSRQSGREYRTRLCGENLAYFLFTIYYRLQMSPLLEDVRTHTDVETTSLGASEETRRILRPLTNCEELSSFEEKNTVLRLMDTVLGKIECKGGSFPLWRSTFSDLWQLKIPIHNSQFLKLLGIYSKKEGRDGKAWPSTFPGIPFISSH